MSESKLVRILVIFSIVAMVCGAYIWLLGPQTLCTLEARHLARTAPFVKERPGELPDSSVSHATGRQLSYFAYEFEVPWDDVDEGKCRIIGGNKAIIVFRSGNVLSVWSGPPHDFVNSTLSNMKIDRDRFRQLYGDEALQSDFAFQRLILNTTPDQITPFISKGLAANRASLLLLKALSAPRGSDSGVFAVTAGEFNGFQFGLPQSSPHGFDVELFSDARFLRFHLRPKGERPNHYYASGRQPHFADAPEDSGYASHEKYVPRGVT